MQIKLSAREQKLLGLLSAIPPEMSSAEDYLISEKLNSDEVTRVGIVYADECFCEAGDFACEHNISHPSVIMPDLHSTYILDVVSLLLRYGLEPNGVYEDYNIMDSLRYVDNEFLAADTLSLLLKNGGKTDLMIPAESETIFQATDFNVFFDAIEQGDRQRYASLVHFWMVLIGYGARCKGDKIRTFKEFNSSEMFALQKLKNHRDYFFGLTYGESGVVISIYDKKTLWEVAHIA